jgi:hypothetical protein
MGTCKRTSSSSESPFVPQRTAHTRFELVALLMLAAGGCTAAGDLEPNPLTTEPGAGGVAGSKSPSAPGQAPSRSPVSPPMARSPGKTASPVDLFPVDEADQNAGGTPSGAGAVGTSLDAGLDAFDAGDGGDAGASPRDGGPQRDAGAPPSVDASAAPNAGDASPPPNALDASPAPARAPCPGLSFEGSCYEFFDEQTSWSEAEARCAAWGGHLASVETPEEDAFLGAWPGLLGVALLDGSGLWLGGTDALRDGDFRWSEDRSLDFVGWASDQPNNGAGVDCIEKRNDATQRWYDRRCTDAERYVCERPE